MFVREGIGPVHPFVLQGLLPAWAKVRRVILYTLQSADAVNIFLFFFHQDRVEQLMMQIRPTHRPIPPELVTHYTSRTVSVCTHA